MEKVYHMPIRIALTPYNLIRLACASCSSVFFASPMLPLPATRSPNRVLRLLLRLRLRLSACVRPVSSSSASSSSSSSSDRMSFISKSELEGPGSESSWMIPVEGSAAALLPKEMEDCRYPWWVFDEAMCLPPAACTMEALRRRCCSPI